MKVSKIIISLAVATSLYGAPQSIEYCQKYVDFYSNLYTQNHLKINQYQTTVDDYLKKANSATSLSTKNFYLSAAESMKKIVQTTIDLDITYKKFVDDWNKKLDESVAYYTPKQTIQTNITSPIPLTTSIEYKNSNVYDSIGVSTAWTQGYTGKGVTVAVIDTGISALNSDLSRFLKQENIIDFGSQRINGISSRKIITLGSIADITYSSISGVTKKTYTTAPKVIIEGNGTGAEAISKIDASGKIMGIYMTEFGKNYSGNVKVLLVDENGVIDNTLSITASLAGIDTEGHGTAVSSLIAGAYNNSGIVGIAYDANLISVKVGNSSSLNITDAIDGARLAAERGATIINQSFETSTVLKNTYINSYKEMLGANVSFVTAAGNRGKSCLIASECNQIAIVPSLIGSSRNNLPGAYIVVGALNSNNTDIASYSNRAGITKDYYILAPGTVGVDALGDTTKTMQGTSFSAPIVSGTMALLQQKWPRLSGSQQAQILFKTADDMGVAGVDDIYGWGKLNINKAFSPVGDLVVSNGINNVASLDKKVSMKAVTTSVSGSSLVTAKIASLTRLNETVAFDDFNRDYQINLTSTVQISKPTFNQNQFTEIPISKNYILGLNNTYDVPSIGYKFDKNKVSYSMVDGYFGAEGSGVLGFSGKTHYVSFNRADINKEMTGFELGLTVGYAQVENNTDSNIKINDSTSIGLSFKGMYKGFGVVGYIPGYITSGYMSANIPTGSDINGNISYTQFNESMRSNTFERTGGVGYFTKNLSLTIEKTQNQYNIAGLDSNAIRLNSSWTW